MIDYWNRQYWSDYAYPLSLLFVHLVASSGAPCSSREYLSGYFWVTGHPYCRSSCNMRWDAHRESVMVMAMTQFLRLYNVGSTIMWLETSWKWLRNHRHQIEHSSWERVERLRRKYRMKYRGFLVIGCVCKSTCDRRKNMCKNKNYVCGPSESSGKVASKYGLPDC